MLKSTPILNLSLVSVLLLAGCSSDTPEKTSSTESTSSAKPESPATDNASPTGVKTYATPEEVFSAFKTAAKSKDWNTMAGCLDKKSQASFSLMMMLPASMMSAFDPAVKTDFEALLKKHGVDEKKMEAAGPGADSPEAASEQLASTVGDSQSFLVDLLTFMDSHADESEDSGFAMENGKLENLEIDGDKATGVVTSEGNEEPIEFAKVAGSWKLVIPLESLMGGEGDLSSSSGNIDFSSTGGGDDFDWEFAESEELPPPENVTLKNFESWKITVDEKDKPAREVIAAQAAACGLEFYNAGDFDSQLSQPVTIDLKDVSRLQVIEAACQQVGLYPRYNLRKIAFAEGPRRFPATFSGPFAIIADKLEEYVPYGAGSLKLKIIASGLDTNAVSYLKELNVSDSQSEDALTHAIDTVTSAGGENLLSPVNRGSMMPSVTKTTFLYETNVSLRNLVRGVESIASIDGELSFEVPTKTESLKFEKLEEGSKLKSGEITLELKRVSTDENSSDFSIAFEGIEPGRIQFVAKSSAGTPLNSFGQSSFSMGNSGEISPNYEGKAATLEVTLILDSERLQMPYTLENLPLGSFSEQPEKLEPLAFEGDAPVVVKFLKIEEADGQKKITASFTNNSNKSIMAVFMNLDYLDAAGKKLDDFPHTHSGGRDFLPAGETREVEIHAFFAPEETKSASFTLNQISFSDESEWNKDE